MEKKTEILTTHVKLEPLNQLTCNLPEERLFQKQNGENTFTGDLLGKRVKLVTL